MFSLLQFYKIEVTSGCKIKELHKTWSNFIALQKLVCNGNRLLVIVLVTIMNVVNLVVA